MKTTLTGLFLMFFVLNLQAQKCLDGNCQSGHGVMETKEGAVYKGPFKNGMFNGIGYCEYPDGSTYHGGWLNGQYHGKGIKILPDKSILSGEWNAGKLTEKDNLNSAKVKTPTPPKADEEIPIGPGCLDGDCVNGRGIYEFPTGAVYVGEFKNGEIHGAGVCVYPDGSKYEGRWEHRFPEGYGTRTYADGKDRTGFWKKGLPVDEAGNYLDDELVARGLEEVEKVLQTGCILGNCKEGQGIYAYPDGTRYEGAFKNSLPNGNGVFYFINGEKYVGDFEDGKRSGKGKMVRRDNSTYNVGAWLEDEYLGNFKEGVGGRSLGCIQGDCFDGYGTYNFPSGDRYRGPFYNNKPHGRGTVYFQEGQRYEGELQNGEIHGIGTLFNNDGTQISGRWKDGKYVETIHRPTQPYPPRQGEGTVGQTPSRRGPDVKVWAVIVGVATYNHMRVLNYTDDDAYRIYAFLKSPEGGALSDSQIRILIDDDATERKIKRTMKEVFEKAGPNDLVMLYFSGHGIKGAFLPSDYDGVNNKLEHSEINDIFRSSRAKYKLCIADACHSGSLFQARSGGMPEELVDNYYSSLARSRAGTALIMSSKSEETSLESSGLRQGVFSHFLIRGLKGEADRNRNNIVTVQELFDFINVNVRSYTKNRQSPMIRGDYDKNMTVAVHRGN